jgi:hypothetical protein
MGTRTICGRTFRGFSVLLCIFFFLRIHKQCRVGTHKNIFRPDGHQTYSGTSPIRDAHTHKHTWKRRALLYGNIFDILRDETHKAGAFDEQEPHHIC